MFALRQGWNGSCNFEKLLHAKWYNFHNTQQNFTKFSGKFFHRIISLSIFKQRPSKLKKRLLPGFGETDCRFNAGPLSKTVARHWTDGGWVLYPMPAVVTLLLRRWPTQQTQNICITFVQYWVNVEDVDSTLRKCYTNVLCLLGSVWPTLGVLYLMLADVAQLFRRWPSIGPTVCVLTHANRCYTAIQTLA